MKKLLQVAATVGVLLAGYAGYVRGFAILAARYAPIYPFKVINARPQDSETAKQAKFLAATAFGPGHWSADPKQSNIQFIDTQRGYWFYAGNYKREGDGRRITFFPFAVVSVSGDRRTLKTIVGKEAILDFNEPFNISKPGGKASHVVHAVISDDVTIRDNRGTPADPADDLVIRPASYLEFDEHDLQIRTKEAILLTDRDLRLTATGLQIDLRPSDGPARPGAAGSGFDGAQTAWLMKDIRIHVDDVGKSGILPGQARGGAAGAKTPLEVECDGPMRIDLPKPTTPVRVGPPAPSGPTLARFEHNVVVRRGSERPDKLTCDTLLLTLVPSLKPPRPPAPPAGAEAAPPAPAGPGGPLSELALRRADADGHAVCLHSDAQGTRARCNQLIYWKLLPERPDETYLRADRGTKFHLEKTDLVAAGKDKGKVQSFTTLEAVDVTLFQDGAEHAQGPGRVVARGPGWLETRPEPGRPVERRATWQEELIMESKSQDVEPHRLVYLTGSPTLTSPTQGDLTARDQVILCLVPIPKPAAVAKAPPPDRSPESAAQGHQIKWLRALGDVHMVSSSPSPAPVVADGAPAPASKKTMHAKDWLFVRFEPPDPASAPPAPAPVAAAPPPADPGADPAAPAAPAPVAEAIAAAPPEPEAPEAPKAAEPDMDVAANTIWARVLMGGGPSKGEVRQVFLRGEVTLHQGAAPGKARGTDIHAEKVDVTNQGPGRALLLAHGPDNGWARAITEESEIEGPILGLDQARDHAWVNGPGRLTQLADARLIAEAPAPAPPPRDKSQEKAAPAKRPVVITWDSNMEFDGQTPGDRGQPGPAEAHFFGNVDATMDDSRLRCRREMVGRMDRVVHFVRPAPDPKAARPEEPEPRPQLVALRGLEAVTAESRKVDPRTGAFQELQRIAGEDITYEKTSNTFWVDSPGLVRLYQLADPPVAAPAAARPLSALEPARDGVILRVADRRVPGTVRAVPGPRPAAPRPGPRPKPKAPPRDPLMLTQILFQSRMEGEMLGAPAGAPSQSTRREARFYGGVEVLRARVGDEDALLNSDRPPLDLMKLCARADDERKPSLTVESLPPPPKSQAKPRNLLRALGEATAFHQGNTIASDSVKFDSLTELAIAESLNGAPVTFSRQDAPGQVLSANSGEAYVYNLKSGEGQVVGGSQIQLFESNKGLRFTPVGPDDGSIKPKKPKRLKPALPSRSDKDRRGFTGH